jgi:DNA polymerase-3 subunit alpha
MTDFVHLNLHSQFSILNSTVPISDLLKKCVELKFTAVALTDFGNLYGAIDFYKEAKAHQIKPIIGLEIMIAPQSCQEKKKQYGVPVGEPITLIAKNIQGYANLCKLSSLGFLEGFYYYPRIDLDLLAQHKEGLICLSGSTRSKISRLVSQGEIEEAKKQIAFFKQLFGSDFYLEVQRHRMSEKQLEETGISKESWLLQEYQALVAKQEKIITEFKKLQKEFDLQLVATNSVHYLHQDEWMAHQILMNVQSGETCEIYSTDAQGNKKGKVLNPKRETLHSCEYYFKSKEEMAELFSDCIEACENTVLIASQCSLEIDFKSRYYPVFVPPELEGKNYTSSQRQLAAENFLKTLCHECIPKRYSLEKLEKVKEQYPDQDPLDVVRKRVDYELNIILSKGMCDYILIVYDFIHWAKSQKIPVGPGRGSGAGSIILYLIGITDIEPLRFNLFFERFINPERISYPDVDVDICMDRRQEVIDYTIRKYGKEKAAQIITFGTMKAKMAIKDVGRVLNVPIAKVNEIAKAVPDDLTITLKKALEIDLDFKELYENDDDAKQIIDYAIQVEGSVRNTGVHAAGIIISGEPLIEKIPVCTSKDSDLLLTQFSMKPVEAVGMLKIDFLGLKTLTSIQKTVDAINLQSKEPIDWINLNLEDQKTFELLNQGKTSGVFQLESSGMQELAKQLHIDKFEEIIAVGALYRPGPMEMIPSFINRKHGKEEIENDHPLMKDILKETYGIIVYQEQVMQIASVLAGYSLGEGDVLRRAMGKKDKAEMARQGEKFRQGAANLGIDPAKAMAIFEKVEKFASYGFNKSHAAAYGFLSYVTAYLKANYPKEWMAALMSCDMVDITKVSKHIRECDALEIAILSPDVNESKGEFLATFSGIRFALCAIKGVGDGVVEAILEERKRNGFFLHLADFIKRVDAKKVGKKTIQNLIDAGCFDFTQKNRASLHMQLETSYDAIAKQQKEKSKGILDLFHQTNEMEENVIDYDLQEIPKLERLAKEKELLGFYLTGHPLQEFKEVIEENQFSLMSHILPGHIGAIKCGLVIETVEIKLSAKSNKKFAVLHVTDGEERQEILLWSDLLLENHHLIGENKLLAAVLMIDRRDQVIKVQVKALYDLSILDNLKLSEIQDQFKKAEQLAKLDAQRGKIKRSQTKEESAEIKKIPMLHLQLKIEAMRLSHVLQLKKIFEKYPGNNKIKIEFKSQNQSKAQLFIENEQGVHIDGDLIQEIEALPYFYGVFVLD